MRLKQFFEFVGSRYFRRYLKWQFFCQNMQIFAKFFAKNISNTLPVKQTNSNRMLNCFNFIKQCNLDFEKK